MHAYLIHTNILTVLYTYITIYLTFTDIDTGCFSNIQISGADDLFKKPLAPPKKDEKSKVGVLEKNSTFQNVLDRNNHSH